MQQTASKPLMVTPEAWIDILKGYGMPEDANPHVYLTALLAAHAENLEARKRATELMSEGSRKIEELRSEKLRIQSELAEARLTLKLVRKAHTALTSALEG